MKIQLILGAFLVGFAHLSFALDQPEVSTGGNYEIQANWSELKHGWNILTIQVSDMNQHPVLNENIEIAYDMVGMTMNPLNNAVVEKGNGLYEKKIFLGMPGKWKFDMKLSYENSEDNFSKVQAVH